MKDKLELDIDDIQVIVHKKETANFQFQTPGRAWDGFVMFTKGCGSVTDEKGVTHKISCGDVFLTRKGDAYTIEAEQECAYVTSGIRVKTDKSILPVIYKCTERQQANILEITRLWQSYTWDSYAQCRIGLLKFYLEIIKETVEKRNVDNDIAKAIEFIHEHFKTNFTGKELAEYCAMSVSYLRGRFLKQTGQTIGKYRDSLRIAAAKEMLESRCFTVTEIARELGYCDVYHFSKVFSGYTGMPPSRWIHRMK